MTGIELQLYIRKSNGSQILVVGLIAGNNEVPTNLFEASLLQNQVNFRKHNSIYFIYYIYSLQIKFITFSTKFIELFSRILKLHFYIEAYSVESGTSKVELFAKIVNSWKQLTTALKAPPKIFNWFVNMPLLIDTKWFIQADIVCFLSIGRI